MSAQETGSAAPPTLGSRNGLRTSTFPALGGIRFTSDDSHAIYSVGDRVMVDPIGSGTAAFRVGTAYLGLTTQGADGSTIRTVRTFVELVESVDGMTIEPNGRSVDLFGHRLVGYSVTRNQSSSPSVSGGVEDWAFSLFASTRLGAPVLHAWAPQGDELFLADTTAGVLYAGYGTAGDSRRPIARPAFEMLISSAVLTGRGLDDRLPVGSAPTPTAPAPAAAQVVADGPTPLRAVSGDVLPGSYQVPNSGLAVSADLTGWRVNTNRPGTTVIAGRDSAGPGDSEIVFMHGRSITVTPVGGGPNFETGADVRLDVEALLAEPPPGLELSKIESVDVAGLPAIRFDARVADDVACTQEAPCEFALLPEWAPTLTGAIRSGALHRIWFLADHPSGSGLILAVDPDPRFIDRSTEFVESLEPLA